MHSAVEQARFSIVMPTFKRTESLCQAVAAIAAQEYPRELYELVVVDDEGDGRAEEALKAIETHGLTLTVESQRRRGAAAARNRGARHAKFEILLFVDDDIIVGPDHLRRHVRSFPLGGSRLVNGHWEFTPEVEATLLLSPFGRYRLALEREFAASARGVCVGAALYTMPLLGGWDLAVDRAFFERIGGFDEEFPVAGAEDQDFSIRARQCGAELVLDTSIVCLHNDNRIDLRSYCAREERSASTMPFLARKYPEIFASSPYVVENSALRVGDSPGIAAKKLAKKVLASKPIMPVVHTVIRLAEASRLPEGLLRRLYSIVLGLHLYRGFRSTHQL